MPRYHRPGRGDTATRPWFTDLASLVVRRTRTTGGRAQLLKDHYDPAVARLAALFEQPFKPTPQDLTYYLTQTYTSVCPARIDARGRGAVTY